jgi:hypothetical protein
MWKFEGRKEEKNFIQAKEMRIRGKKQKNLEKESYIIQ